MQIAAPPPLREVTRPPDTAGGLAPPHKPYLNVHEKISFTTTTFENSSCLIMIKMSTNNK